MKIQIEITNVIDLIPNFEYNNTPQYFNLRAKILLFNITINLFRNKKWWF